jgi:hypothetical protein
MTEAEARARSAQYKQHDIKAVARAKPHPDGWPNVSDEWEVALYNADTRHWDPEPQP